MIKKIKTTFHSWMDDPEIRKSYKAEIRVLVKKKHTHKGITIIDKVEIIDVIINPSPEQEQS